MTAEARRIRARPQERCFAIVLRGRPRMLRLECVFDVDHDDTGFVGYETCAAIRCLDAAVQPAAAMEVDQYRHRSSLLHFRRVDADWDLPPRAGDLPVLH